MRKLRHPCSLPYARVPKRLGVEADVYASMVELAPVRKVRIAHLHATQRYVSPSRVIALMGVEVPRGKRTSLEALDDRPVVMRRRPGPGEPLRMYLINGHHRVEGRLLRGKRSVRVRLIDL